MMKRWIAVLAVILAGSISAFSTVAVTVNVSSVATTVPTSSITVRFQLQNCNGNVPRIISTSTIVQTSYDFKPNSSGVVSGTIYGNDEIDCGGYQNSTYAVIYLKGGIPISPSYSYIVNASAVTFNPQNATPITSIPAIFPPVGDNTYLRLDSGNSGSSTLSLNVVSLNGTVFADKFPGADLSAKIANAILALPATGGTVDARGLSGAQTSSADPFTLAGIASSRTKPVRILLPAGTITQSATWLPNSGSVIQGFNGTIPEGPSIGESGTIVSWSGAINLPVFKYYGTSGTVFDGITIEGNDVSGVIGILTDSNSLVDGLSHGSHSIFKNFSIRNTEKAMACGDTSDVAATSSNAYDLQEITNFHIQGGVSTTNRGFHINSSDCFDGGLIANGSFQGVNIGVDIINGGGPYFQLDRLTSGDGTALQSTMINIGPGTQFSPGITNSHNEGNMYYFIHDSSCSATMPGNGYTRAAEWAGNAFVGHVLIDGCDYVKSSHNSGHGVNTPNGGLWNVAAKSRVYSEFDSLYTNPLTPLDTNHFPWQNSWTVDTIGNSGATRTSNIATIKTTTPHALAAGSYVSVAGVSNATFVSSTITNVSLASNVVTVTALNAFFAGQKITFSGVGTATYLNGFTVVVLTASPTQFTATFTHGDDLPAHADTGSVTPQVVKIISVPSTTSFTYANAGTNVGLTTAGGGTITGGAIEGCSQDGTCQADSVVATTSVMTPSITMSGVSQQILATSGGQLDLDAANGNIRTCRSSTNCSFQKFISGSTNRMFEVTDLKSNFFDLANNVVANIDATGKGTFNGGVAIGANTVLPSTLTGFKGSTGTKVQLQDGNATTSGHVAAFDTNGNLTDGGGATVTSVTGTPPIASSGGTTPAISFTPQALLSTLVASDVTAASPTRGDIITAQGASPKWTVLAIGVTGKVLHGGTEPSWANITPSDATGSTTGSGNFCLVTNCSLTTPAIGSAGFTLAGSSSGTLTVKSAATSSGTLTLPAGTTDFSATGGASQVVKQTSSGGAFTVAQLAFTDISGTASTGQIPSLDASKITTGLLALARGGTNADLSGTGGTSQVLKQVSVGAAVTVAQLAFSDISGTATTAQVPSSAPVVFRGLCSGVSTASVTIFPFELGSTTTTCTGTTETQQMGVVIPSSLNGATCGWLQVSAGSAGTNASSGLFTLRKNAVAQTTVCTVGTGVSCNDPGTHTFTVATNDRLTVSFTTQTAETLANVGVSFSCKN